MTSLQPFAVRVASRGSVTEVAPSVLTVRIPNKSLIWSGIKRDKNLIKFLKKRFDVVGASRTVVCVSCSLLGSNATQVCDVLICTCRMVLCYRVFLYGSLINTCTSIPSGECIIVWNSHCKNIWITSTIFGHLSCNASYLNQSSSVAKKLLSHLGSSYRKHIAIWLHL